MFTLAMRSVRQRPGRFTATLLCAFLGAAIIMTFGSLQDTAGAEGVDSVSADTLTISANVVGGYSALLVFFAVASALTVNVRQRAEEIALLRRTGATPAQITRTVVGESAVVSLAGALLAAGPAVLGGRALLDLFKDGGQVSGGVDPVFGPYALVSGVTITVLASVGAAFLAVRRATKGAAGTTPDGGASVGRAKKAAALTALVAGTGAVCATFALRPTDAALMAAPAYGAILLSLGFAVFSPSLLRALLGALERPLSIVAGASGYLTIHQMRRRAGQLSGVLFPLILFTCMANATLSMQAVESDAIRSSGLARSVEDRNLETLNTVVVGIIVVFSCVMLVNSLYASTSYRAGEFGRQRLAGATPGQVLGTVGLEALVLTVTGVFFGTVAALAGLVPFTVVRTDAVFPDQGLGIWLGTVAVAATATLVTSVATAAGTLRTPAIRAVTPAV